MKTKIAWPKSEQPEMQIFSFPRDVLKGKSE
jgi:hypothetical protein